MLLASFYPHINPLRATHPCLLTRSSCLHLQAIITLAELPQGTRTIVVSMANMAGSGLKDVSSLQVGGRTWRA